MKFTLFYSYSCSAAGCQSCAWGHTQCTQAVVQSQGSQLVSAEVAQGTPPRRGWLLELPDTLTSKPLPNSCRSSPGGKFRQFQIRPQADSAVPRPFDRHYFHASVCQYLGQRMWPCWLLPQAVPAVKITRLCMDISKQSIEIIPVGE